MAQAFNLTAQLNLRGPSNVKQIVSDIRKQIGTIEGEVKFKLDATSIGNTAKLNQSLQALNKNLSLVTTNASAASAAIKNFGQSVSSVGNTSAKLASSVSKAAKSTDNLGVSSSKSAKNVGIARTEMEEFGRQSALAIRRFAAFSAVTGIFFSLNRAINSGLKSFIEFDRQLVKLQQVTGKNAEGLKGLQDEITRLAVGLGVSSDSLIDVSSTLAQAGLSANDTKVALEALARSSLAPSFDDMNQTVEGSIALMKQFGISAKDLEKALGSVNSVAAAFAVESSDIISAIQRTGGVFANASRGVSEGTDALNEFIAVFTSVRATTRESAETIATGLRTIFTRIQRQGTIEALKEYGVTLTDTEGKFVGAYKAVQLLSEGLGRIDPRDLRFSQIVEELGGFRQIGKVIPLIQQFATAQEALKIAQAGQGSLASDAVKAQLSLANQISKVREEFLTLIRSLGQSDTFQTLAKGALTFASGLIKITDALKGVLPALAILGAGAGLRGITQFTGGFIGGLKKVKTGPGEQNQSVAGAIGNNLASSLVGAKTEQVSRDLDQNSASLDKVSDRLGTLTSSLNNLDANFNTINSILNTNNTLLQQSIASLSSNTSSLDNLTNTINNLNIGGGPGPATIRNGGRILGFAKGGSVPGSGKGDKVPALLEPGEVVMSNSAVNKYGRGNLVRMNKRAIGGPIKEDLSEIPTSPKNKTPLSRTLNTKTPTSYFKNINDQDNASMTLIDRQIDLDNSDFATMERIIAETRMKTERDLKKFSTGRAGDRANKQAKKRGFASAANFFESRKTGENWEFGNAFQQLLVQKYGVKSASTRKTFGTSRESFLDIITEHFAPLDYEGGDAKFVQNIKTVKPIEILSKAVRDSADRRALKPRPTPQLDPFDIGKTEVWYPAEGIKEKFIQFDKNLNQDKNIGGLIQKFMAGGVAEASDAMTLEDAKKKSRQEIMDVLTSRPGGISTTEKAVGVGRGEVYKILGKKNPDATTGSLLDAILKEYTKTYNRQAGAAQGQITRMTNQGLVVAAAGMFGNKFADTTDTIESPLLSSSPQVRIISGVLGAKTAASLESVFAQATEQTTDKGAETLLISDILERFGLGRELNLDFDRTLAIGADDILSDPGAPVFSEFSDRTKVAEALKKARLTALGQALASLAKDRPELLNSAKIVTARPESTLDLVQDWLSSQGLPIPLSQFKGFGGAGVKADDIAKLKAAFLSPGSLFVDDDPRNISAASLRKDVTSYQYGIGKSLPNSQAQGDLQGLLLEQVIQKLGGPGATKGFGFDFPKGLGAAAKYFDLPDDVPTDVKRTISGPSTITDNIVTWLKNVMGYAAGGRVGSFAAGGVAEQSEKKEKNFGKIGLRDDGRSISATYFKNNDRSGSVNAYKMRDYLYYVGLSEATKGYGPRLYDTVMEAVTANGAMLTSDRSSVSGAAKKVWEYYFNNRNDVKKTPLKPDDWTRNQASIDPKLYGTEDTWPPATDPAWILQSGYSKSPDLINDKNSVIRMDKQQDSRSMALNFFRAKSLAAGGKVSLYHGSNTGTDNSVLESFKKEGARSDIAGGYGQGAGFYVYTEKNRAINQAKMRVGGGGNFVLAQGDKSGKPMVLTFNESLDPETYDLDYELQKGLVVQWLANNYEKIKDKIAPHVLGNIKYGGVTGITKKDTTQGIMSDAVRVQTDTGSRKTIYAGNEGDIREGELIGKIMNRLQADDQETVHAFEKELFKNPLGLVLKYVGSSSLKPTNIETFASGGSVPAMVSNGETYVSPKTAKKIGYAKLNKMNQADRNGMSNFAGGGMSSIKGPGSGTSDSIGPVNLPVGSFILRAKATKALGLNKGGGIGIQKFAAGSPGGVPDLILDRASFATIDAFLEVEAKKLGISISDLAKGLKQTGDEARKAAVAAGKTRAEANKAARQAMGEKLGLTTLTKADTALIEQTNSGASRPAPQKVDASARNLDIEERKARKEAFMAQERAKTGATGGTRQEYFDTGVVRPDFDQNSGRGLKSEEFGPALPPRVQKATQTMDAELKSASSVIAKEVKAKWDQLYQEEKASLAQYYQERMKSAKTPDEQSQVASEFLSAKSSLKQDYTTRAQTEFTARRTEAETNIQQQRQGNLEQATSVSSAANDMVTAHKAAQQAAKDLVVENAKQAQESAKAAESLAFMKLKAEQNGQTLTQYQASLKKSIIDNAKILQQAAPGKINQFSQSAFGLTGKIRSGKADDISDAKDILTKQLTDIATGLNPEEISSTIDDLVNSISKGDKSFIDIINSSDSLQKIFKDATSDAGALSKAMQDLSAGTGIPIDALEKLANSADLAASNMYDKNLAAAEKMASNIGKASIAIGVFGSALSKTIRSLGGENDRGSAVTAAAVEGFSSTVSVLGATISQIPSTFDSLRSLTSAGGMLGNTSIGAGINKGLTSAVGLLTNPFVLGGAAVGVAAIGLAAAFKEAHNAAREFDKALRMKNVENAMDSVARSFEDFSKDIKRLDLLDSIRTQLQIAGSNLTENLRIDAEVPKAFWLNLLDVGLSENQGEAAQRSQILEKQGVGAYLQSTQFFNDPASLLNFTGPAGFGLAPAMSGITGSGKAAQEKATANRNFYMQKLAPDMAKEQSAQFKPLAEATQRLFEEKLRTGTSMQDIMGELKGADGPSQLAKNIAQANPVIQEQILRIRASNNLNDDQKKVMENNIVAQEAEYRTRTNLETTLRSMELDKLNREMKKFVVSLERMFNNMGQSIDKTGFELDALSRSAELSSASLSGNAKAGDTSIKGLNVLKNLDVSAPAERESAISQASSFFGSQQDIVKPLLGLGSILEETVLSTFNSAIEKNPGKTDEAISANIKIALDRKLRDLELPSNIADKLSNQVRKSFSEITKQGVDAKDVSFDDIVEQIPAFAESIASARRAEEEAIKAMEFYQKNINEYANAMNQMVDYQIEANNRMRKATEIQAKGNMELSRALGKRVTLDQVRRVEEAPIRSMTGGLTDPGDIGRQVVNLESIRATQQAASDTAANRGTAGKNEFALMQNRLRGTNAALRENIDALKQMADSTELAQAALQKIQDIQAKRQAGANLIEKMVTSSPEELAKLNASMSRLNNNMRGGLNIGSTAEQRGETLQTFNMVAPLLGDGQKQNELRANVLESMLKESGTGIDSTFQEVLNSLRNPEGDPQMAEAISVYRQSIDKQTEANRVLGELQRLMSANTAEIAAQKLSTAIQGVKLTFENKTLDDIRKGIWILVGKAGGEAQGMNLGGIVYASSGQMIDFKPKGTDTVPAMLTPGEFVVNKKATRSNLPLLQSINNGYNKGGKVGYYASGGMITASGGGWESKSEKDYGDRNKQSKVVSQPTIYIKDFGDPSYKLPSDPAFNNLVSYPYSSYGVGQTSMLSDWNSTYYDVPSNFNKSQIQPTMGYGYESVSVPVGGNDYSILENNKAALTIDPEDPVSTIKRHKKNYYLPLSLIKNTEFINSQKKVNVPANKLTDYGNTIKNILRYFPDSGKYEQLQKEMNKEAGAGTPPPLNPNLVKSGNRFKITGLSAIDTSKSIILPEIASDAYEVPDSNAAGQLVGFRQDFGTAAVILNTVGLGAAASSAKTGFQSDGLFTRVVSGTEQMRNSVLGLATFKDYGSILRDKAITYGNPQIDSGNKMRENFKSLDYLRQLLIESQNIIENPKFEESKETIGKKNYLANLEAIYNKNIFKSQFNKDEPFNKNGISFPVTLYNMDKDKWKKVLQSNNLIDQRGQYTDPSYSNIFPKDESEFVTLYESIGKLLHNPRAIPWVSSAFSSIPGGSESIFSGAQKEFETGTGIVKFISSEAKAYSSPDNPFAFTYQDVTGRLYDTISKSFIGDDQKYIVVKTQPENNSFPLSELLSNYDNFLYASSIDSLINNLKNNTPIYDTATGKEISSPGTPYKYSLDGENIGLYDYKLNQDFPSTYSGILDENDKNSIIRSSYGKKDINPVNEFFASKYKEQREKNIENFELNKAKGSTSKAEGTRFEKQEPFSTNARVSVAKAFASTFPDANLGITIPAITKIEDVGGIAGYLNEYLKQLDNKSMEWAKVDAYRGIFKELFKPEPDTLGYLKTFDPAVSQGLINKNAINAILQRELAANMGQNTSGEINEQDIPGLKLDEGKNQFYTVGPDGKKTLQSPENIQFPQTVADVEKIALNPENIFQDETKRQNYLGVLKKYFMNNAYPVPFTEAIHSIADWYTAQDKLLNMSLDNIGLDASLAQLADPTSFPASTISEKPKFDVFNKLLTGEKYGALPDISRMIDRIKVRKNEIAQQPKDQQAQGTQKLARGGVVYASNGSLINFQPKGTDTVPAMLTPGEFVINRSSTQKYRPVLEAINNGNYSRGGVVSYLNKGGYLPIYRSTGGDTAGSFDFTGYVNNLAASLTSLVTEAFDKALSPVKQQNNNVGGVSNNDSSITSIDSFVNRLNNVANILSNVYIPPQITITGKHDVVVTINGDTVLNQLRPDLAGIVVRGIRAAFNNLKAKNPENKTINFDIDIDPNNI